MFIGSAGTGKTNVFRDYLSETLRSESEYAIINFNSYTTSLSLQKNIESRVEKKSGRKFGLGLNKVLIYFIDDLNMPYVDKYGT